MGIKYTTSREKEVLGKIIEVIRENLNPGEIILFGSRAKGIAEKYSDFDLAVDQKRPELKMERKIREEIEEISGLYGVDLVYLNSIDSAFKNIIFNTGEKVYARRS